MGLADDAGPGAVGLDTSAFIYYIEDDPRYAPLLESIFTRGGRDALRRCTQPMSRSRSSRT